MGDGEAVAEPLAWISCNQASSILIIAILMDMRYSIIMLWFTVPVYKLWIYEHWRNVCLSPFEFFHPLFCWVVVLYILWILTPYQLWFANIFSFIPQIGYLFTVVVRLLFFKNKQMCVFSFHSCIKQSCFFHLLYPRDHSPVYKDPHFPSYGIVFCCMFLPIYSTVAYL